MLLFLLIHHKTHKVIIRSSSFSIGIPCTIDSIRVFVCVHVREGGRERGEGGRRGDYGIESDVLFEAFFEECGLVFGEPEFLPGITPVLVFVAGPRRQLLRLQVVLLAAAVPLPLHARRVGEGRHRAVRRRRLLPAQDIRQVLARRLDTCRLPGGETQGQERLEITGPRRRGPRILCLAAAVAALGGRDRVGRGESAEAEDEAGVRDVRTHLREQSGGWGRRRNRGCEEEERGEEWQWAYMNIYRGIGGIMRATFLGGADD